MLTWFLLEDFCYTGFANFDFGFFFVGGGGEILFSPFEKLIYFFFFYLAFNWPILVLVIFSMGLGIAFHLQKQSIMEKLKFIEVNLFFTPPPTILVSSELEFSM